MALAGNRGRGRGQEDVEVAKRKVAGGNFSPFSGSSPDFGRANRGSTKNRTARARNRENRAGNLSRRTTGMKLKKARRTK